MEALTLLKHWRSGHRGRIAAAAATAAASTLCNNAEVPPSLSRDDTDDDSTDGEDEGPFFDLEFEVPEEEDNGGDGSVSEEEGDEESSKEGEVEEEVVGEVFDQMEEEEEREFNFAVSSDGSCGDDPNIPLSPSDDLFFKGRLMPLEPSSPSFQLTSEANTKTQLLPVSLLKSATKFRVFMLGLKKPKQAEAADATTAATPAVAAPSPKHEHHHQQRQQQQQLQITKFFTVKYFKVGDVRMVSLFTRDNSSRSSGRALKPAEEVTAAVTAEEEAAEEKKLAKELVQKYLNKIKPLYMKVSRKQGEKPLFSEKLTSSDEETSKEAEEEVTAAVMAEEAAEEKKLAKELVQKYLNKIKPLYMKVSKKQGEKPLFSEKLTSSDEETSKEADSSKLSEEEVKEEEEEHAEGGEGEGEGAEATPPVTTSCHLTTSQRLTLVANHIPAGLKVVCKRLGKSRSASSAVASAPSPPAALARKRDDSLLQQQDGIQSAIAHCKRSLNNAPNEKESPLPISETNPCSSGDCADGNCAVKCSEGDI